MRQVPSALLVLGVLAMPSCACGFPHDLGLALLVDMPQEDFANISGTGVGVGLKFLRPLKTDHLRLRGDAEVLFFGEEEHVGRMFGYEEDMAVVTRHESLRLLAGVELSSAVTGALRAYLAPMGGLYCFRSVDRISFTSLYETSSSEAKFGWKVDAGLSLTRFRRGWRPRGVELDLGASYGTVRRGVETQLEDRTFFTDANEVTLHLGVIWHQK
jgi:hypothetical protein